MDSLQSYLFLSVILFCLGLYGVMTRRNGVAILMGIELIRFDNPLENPNTTDRTVEVVVRDDTLVDSATATTTISITTDDDAPAVDLDASGAGIDWATTFTEGGANAGLFSSTSIDLVESADRVQTLTLTVAGLQNGADEILVVDNGMEFNRARTLDVHLLPETRIIA